MKDKKKDKPEILTVETEDLEEDSEGLEDDTFGLHPSELAEEIALNPEIAPDPRTRDATHTTRDLPDPVYQEKETEREKTLRLKKMARSERDDR